jgi:hypothetical protein
VKNLAGEAEQCCAEQLDAERHLRPGSSALVLAWRDGSPVFLSSRTAQSCWITDTTLPAGGP